MQKLDNDASNFVDSNGLKPEHAGFLFKIDNEDDTDPYFLLRIEQTHGPVNIRVTANSKSYPLEKQHIDAVSNLLEKIYTGNIPIPSMKMYEETDWFSDSDKELNAIRDLIMSRFPEEQLNDDSILTKLKRLLKSP